MPAIVTKSPAVLDDLASQAEYIARHSFVRSDRFLAAVESTFRYLAEYPDVGFPCQFESHEALGMRWWRVQGHRNHVVFYRSTADGIDIVRLLHGARNAERLFQSERD